MRACFLWLDGWMIGWRAGDALSGEFDLVPEQDVGSGLLHLIVSLALWLRGVAKGFKKRTGFGRP
jgi:hypothetical protein